MDSKEEALRRAQTIIHDEMDESIGKLRFVRELILNLVACPNISPMKGEEESAIWTGLYGLLRDVTMAYDSTSTQLAELVSHRNISDS